MSRTRALIAAAAAGLVALAVAPQAALAVYPAMDLTDLARAADAVVIATPVGSAVRDARRAGARRPFPVTDTRLRVVHELAGDRPATVSVSQPGGAVDGTELLVPDSVDFTPRETYVLFLSADDRLVGGPQGARMVDDGRVAGLGVSPLELEAAVTEARRGFEAFDASPSASVEGPWVVPGVAGVGASSVTVSSVPVVTSVTPAKQVAGRNREITIAGSGFGATQGTGSVRFVHGLDVYGGLDPVAAPVVSWSDTAVRVRVPRHASSGHMQVITGSGAVAAPYYDVSYSTNGQRFPATQDSPVTYRVNENYAGMTGEAAEISTAMTTWSNAGSRFSVIRNGTSSASGTTTNANYVSEIWFAPLGEDGPLAINYLWPAYTGGPYDESDIIFNSDYQWRAGATSTAFDVQSIALHELGHTVGLDDQYPNTWRVMGAAERGVNRRALTADEVAGALDLHGTEPPPAPAVSSSSHPLQEQWYANGVASFAFGSTGIVDGYSYVLDGSSATNPDSSVDTTATNLTLPVVDGDRWLHVRAVNAGGAGPVTHYRVRTDTTAPAGSVALGGGSTYASSTALPVAAALSDAHSGLARMRFDGGAGWGPWAPYEAETTLTLVSPDGTRTVLAEYADAAGNVRAASREVVLDRAAPASAALVESAGATATVTIVASDTVSGVARTFYRVDGGDPLSYDAPVTITQPGEHVVAYFSLDLAGNQEPERTVSVAVPWPDPDPDPEPDPDPDPGSDPGVSPDPVPRATRIGILPASRLTPAYGAGAQVVARLESDDGAPVTGAPVALLGPTGAVVRGMSPVAGVPGAYWCTAPVVGSRTVFRATFAGDASASASACDVVVRPQVSLSRRVPSSARPAVPFVVYGAIRPAHASAPVRVEVRKRRADGSYVPHRASKTVRTSASAVRTRLTLSRGTYRIRFVHEDAGHSRTSTSWATVRVR